LNFSILSPDNYLLLALPSNEHHRMSDLPASFRVDTKSTEKRLEVESSSDFAQAAVVQHTRPSYAFLKYQPGRICAEAG
jgi:hypothetical protein